MEYDIISDHDHNNLIKAVNDKLKNGWTLAGNLVTVERYENTTYMQPVKRSTQNDYITRKHPDIPLG